MSDLVFLEVKTPREGEETPEAMVQFLSSLAQIRPPQRGGIFSSAQKPLIASLELAVIDGVVRVFVAAPSDYHAFVSSQLLAQYPKATITQVENPFHQLFSDPTDVQIVQMNLRSNFLYPLKTFKDIGEIDSMAPLVGLMSKLPPTETILVQISLYPATSKWQGKGQRLIEKKKEITSTESTTPDNLLLNTYAKQIESKVAYPGFVTGIKIITKGTNDALPSLTAACFNSFNNTAGNSLGMSGPKFWQKNSFYKSAWARSADSVPDKQILNIVEIASLFHLPTTKLAGITNLAWAKTIVSEAPDNLPIDINLTESERREVNFFARTIWRNQPTEFGILKNDRRRHMYIIGKSGTGKSTLIANLAINDIRNGEGVAVIDPHGDLCNHILDYIPESRIKDLVYMDPADVDFPFHLNPLEIDDPSQKDLVASGIVSIFYKLYANSWGPRLEYILRNTLLSLLEYPDATMLMVPNILNNANFRAKVVETLTDPVLKNFWINEYNKMGETQRVEAVASILNKVGQFLSAKAIRHILGAPKSTISLEDCMNHGKIVLLNLSQGKMGEDASSLLGAMIITKLQLAAMNRVNVAEHERKDFYLYVDEFQNFATSTFVKILSEARKYHLDLILANQYTAQIPEDVRSAIIGNAGTIISFLIGAEDAPLLAREFAERFKETDLLALGNYQIILKMAINSITSPPFYAQTLALPVDKTENRQLAIDESKQRYNRAASELKFYVDEFVPTAPPPPIRDYRPRRDYPSTTSATLSTGSLRTGTPRDEKSAPSGGQNRPNSGYRDQNRISSYHQGGNRPRFQDDRSRDKDRRYGTAQRQPSDQRTSHHSPHQVSSQPSRPTPPLQSGGSVTFDAPTLNSREILRRTGNSS